MAKILGKDEGPKCPGCDKRAIHLRALNDDGTGKRMCGDCKKRIKREAE